MRKARLEPVATAPELAERARARGRGRPVWPQGSGAQRRHAIAAGVSYALLARALSSAAAFASQVVVARWLGPEGNGLLATAMSVLAIAMLVADLGVNTAVSRLLAAAYYRDPAAAPRILAAGALLKMLLTLAAGGALWCGAGALAQGLRAPAALVPVLVMAAAQLVLDNAATFCFRALQGLHLPGRQAFAQALSGMGSPLLALLVLGLVMGAIPLPAAGGEWLRAALADWLGGAGGAAAAGPPAVVLGRALGAALAALWAAWVLLRLVPGLRTMPPAGTPGRLAVRPFAEIRAFARAILWVQVAYLVVFRCDLALVQLFCGPREVGLYALPAQMGEKLMLPAAALAAVIAPYFAALDDAARRPLLRALLGRAAGVLAVLYLPAAVGLAVLAPELVRAVFGPAYDPAAPLVRAYAAALPVVALATLLGQLLDYAGLVRTRAVAFAGAAALDLGLNLVLVPRWGGMGAIAALLVSFGPLVCLYAAALGRALGLGARAAAATVLAAAGASTVMAAALWALRPGLAGGGGGPGGAAALVLAGMAVYAAALAALLPLLGGRWPVTLADLRGLGGRGAGHAG